MAYFKFRKSEEKTTTPLTDEQVVERVLAGEQQYLEVLYDRYSGKIFHKCLSIIKDRESAKDCTHDIMVKIFMNLAGFKGRSAFSLWVHSITYNFCMDFVSKRKRTDHTDYNETEKEFVSEDEEELENKIIHDAKLVELENAFEKLNPDDRILLMMRYQDGMSVKDISESLQVGESAIKMRLKRSRDRLADLIDLYS